MMKKICIVDDEPCICESLKWILEREGYEVKFEMDLRRANRLIKREDFNVFLINLTLSSECGLQLVKKINELKKNGKVIIMTGCPSIQTLIEAIRLNAYDYLNKPISPSKLKDIIKHAISLSETIT